VDSPSAISSFLVDAVASQVCCYSNEACQWPGIKPKWIS
jgi:hypothetical protein